jgi:hypothetical protein
MLMMPMPLYGDRELAELTVNGHGPARMSSCFGDRISMALANEADDIARAVDDDGKEVGDVAAEHAHVKRIGLGECREGSPEEDRATIFTPQSNLRIDGDGENGAAH